MGAMRSRYAAHDSPSRWPVSSPRSGRPQPWQGTPPRNSSHESRSSSVHVTSGDAGEYRGDCGASGRSAIARRRLGAPERLVGPGGPRGRAAPCAPRRAPPPGIPGPGERRLLLPPDPRPGDVRAVGDARTRCVRPSQAGWRPDECCCPQGSPQRPEPHALQGVPFGRATGSDRARSRWRRGRRGICPR